MAGWIFDENITRVAKEMFGKSGISGVHIQYDLQQGGIEDPDVLQLAKREKKTLITANTEHFLKMPDVSYRNTCGAFILSTSNPSEQVRQVKMAAKYADLDSLKKRKNKKVYIKSDGVEVLDVMHSTRRAVVFSDVAKK